MKATIKEISGTSWKFFCTPTTKCRPCNIFAALNGNHLLMANVFKLQFVKRFGLLLMGCRKCSFSDFYFYFCKFQMMIFKNLMEKSSVFIMDFECSYEVLLHHKYFLIYIPFDNETIAILIFFFLIFANFKWWFSKILWKNHPFS